MDRGLYDNRVDRVSRWWRWLTADPIVEAFNITGLDYTVKMTFAEFRRRAQHHDELTKRFNERPSLEDVARDNCWRFTLGAVLDRLTITRQTSLFTGFQVFRGIDSLSWTFSASGLGSFFRGALKGNLINTLQFLGVHSQALLLSNHHLGSFIGYFLALDALLHPLDTLRTRWTADSADRYRSFADCARKTPVTQLFNGFVYRSVYSGLLATYFAYASSEQQTSVLGLGLLALAYPFLTLKTISQVSPQGGIVFTDLRTSASTLASDKTVTSLRVLYRGFLPFLLLNTFAPYYFPQVWTAAKQGRELQASGSSFQPILDVNKRRY